MDHIIISYNILPFTLFLLMKWCLLQYIVTLLRAKFLYIYMCVCYCCWILGSTDGTIGLNSCIRLDNRESIGWAAVGDMLERRGYGGYSLGPSNRFYASGGLHNSVLKGTMEYFDPRKGIWTQVDVSGDGSSEVRHPFSPASLPSWRSNKHLMRSGHQMIYLWEG